MPEAPIASVRHVGSAAPSCSIWRAEILELALEPQGPQGREVGTERRGGASRLNAFEGSEHQARFLRQVCLLQIPPNASARDVLTQAANRAVHDKGHRIEVEILPGHRLSNLLAIRLFKGHPINHMSHGQLIYWL
jgi:hypothetical protein